MASRVLFLLLSAACSQSETSTAKPTAGVQQRRDTVATAVIQPGGGTVELPGIGRVIFPAGAFRTPQVVKVFTTHAPETAEAQTRWDVSVGPPGPLPYDVRINTGSVAPATAFQVALVVPESYLNGLPPNHSPRVFAQMVSGGAAEDLDLYEVLEGGFDPATRVVPAVVPTSAVRPPVRGGMFEVILLVGAVLR